MIHNRQVQVTFFVDVCIDDNKFTQQVMDDFSEVIFKINDLNGHAQHIAKLCAQGETNFFVEGYGELSEVGVTAEIGDVETQIIDSVDAQGRDE